MNKQNQTILAVVLVVTCVALRLASNQHLIPNFTPILAMGLFAGSIFANKKLAMALPIITMFASDLCFQLFTKTQGFYGVSQIFDYTAFGLVALLGTTLRNRNTVKVLGYAISGSLIFFVISNFGVWADGSNLMYPKTVNGLMNCFAMGIPFYKNSIISDILFSAIFFGLYHFTAVSAVNKIAKAS